MLLTIAVILAQASDDVDYGAFFKWIGVIVIALMFLAVVVAWLRKRIKEDDAPAGTGFSLSEFRKLHKEGKMTDEEFERAKAMIVGTVKAVPPGEKSQPPRAPGRGEDGGRR